MEEPFESLIRGKNSLAEVRRATESNPGLLDALRDSMEHPIQQLCHRFSLMKLKDQSIVIRFPAIEDEIKTTLHYLRFMSLA